MAEGRHSASLPTTPKGGAEPANSTNAKTKPQQMMSQPQVQSPMVATLFKDLRGSSKKKGKHKRQPQQHLAQTSPALVAILKSLKEPSAKKPSEDTAPLPRSERTAKPITIVKTELGKRIVLQGKKEGSKLTTERSNADAMMVENVRVRPTKKPAGKRVTMKSREKSKSQVQAQGQIPGAAMRPSAKAINVTAEQIRLGEEEENESLVRDTTPLRDNYVQEKFDPASVVDTNKTY